MFRTGMRGHGGRHKHHGFGGRSRGGKFARFGKGGFGGKRRGGGRFRRDFAETDAAIIVDSQNWPASDQATTRESTRQPRREMRRQTDRGERSSSQGVSAIVNPCIDVCSYNNGICMGCYRSREEVRTWRGLSDEQKRDVIAKTDERRTAN